MDNGRTYLFVSAAVLALLVFGGTGRDNNIPVRFSHPDVISYNHDGFIVHGKPVFIYSGSFHYFRCDPSEWMDRLEKIKAAGFNTIETYVPWNWHERTEGHTDFAPLVKFLDDCRKEGLYVIIRPGPYICAEWNIGGFPDWLEGKNVGFRTASRADIRWSKYWYDEVLPVIRKHLITNGGSIILMQIENEYDFFHLPDSAKIVYLKSLYRTAVENGIDVPIITCWTNETRDNSDSVFSQIMDACNFYPGWNIKSTLPAITRMEKEEPASPPTITELQGGWFSEFGDKSVRRVDDFGPRQVTALTGYVIAHGIKALNYYMLYGGTNFGYWGSWNKTTSYDYTAPISEPGGLWAKYRAVKLIGDFIKLEGDHLIRSHEVRGGARSETPGVETIMRSDGSAGFLYVHNSNKKAVAARVHFNPPAGPPVTMTVKLAARGTYLLPVDLPLPGGGRLGYTNVPVSAIGEHNGKPVIVAYGSPGDEAAIYAGSSLFTGKIEDTDRLFNKDGVYILLTTEDRAGRSRVFETPEGPVSLVSDSYLLLDRGKEGKSIRLDLQERPGYDSFSLLGPRRIASVYVDGKRAKTTAEGREGMMKFSVKTPSFGSPKIQIKNLKAEADAAAPDAASWKTLRAAGDTLAPLETEGDYASGYTVYSGNFSNSKPGFLKVDFYFDDWHSVLVDGKSVPGLTGTGRENFATHRIDAGTHSMEIIYENGGWPNFQFMEQKKGLKSVSIATEGHIGDIDRWKHSPAPAPAPGSNPPEASPSFNDASWPVATVGHGNQSFIKPHEGWWFRTHVKLSEEAIKDGASLTFGAVDDNAIVYVNGRKVADHHGYDTAFKIPLAHSGTAGDNVVAVYLDNEGGGGGIWKPVVFKWENAVPLGVQLKFHHSLNGRLAGWQENRFDDSKWKSAGSLRPIESRDGITWYRGEFTVPSKPGWIIPWRLHFESTGSAQIWINGRLLGRYSSRGPQENFYLPDGWLNIKGRNTVTFVLRPGGNGSVRPEIKQAYVMPYDEYVVQKHTLRITLK